MIRVIRVGGSLLTWPSFVTAFSSWLDQQPESTNILIAGGGPWVELIRQAATRFDVEDEAAHWLAIHAMSTTAELLATLLKVESVSCWERLQTIRRGVVVFQVESFLRMDASGPQPLPRSWDVTSDSIAAKVAGGLGADELVLLKSNSPPSGAPDFETMANNGYVDRFFPQSASQIERVRYINLRTATSLG